MLVSIGFTGATGGDGLFLAPRMGSLETSVRHPRKVSPTGLVTDCKEARLSPVDEANEPNKVWVEPKQGYAYHS